MLTPEQLTSLTENSTVLELWRQLETDILTDMARRIGKTDFGTVTETAIWQAYRLEQSRLFRSAVVAKLARLTGKSRKAVKDLLQQAGTYTLLNDDAVYRGAGRKPPPLNESAALLNLLNAGASQTSGTMQNLTATTADTASRQFENALDRAWMQVSSGAFDYRSAIRRAIGTLSSQGLRCIEYTHTGHIDTLETAVRRAVLTGVNQTCAKLQVERMNQMGCEFVEVTAHAGARPNHAEWQGQVFHRGGSVRYQGVFYADFVSSTGYGTGEGLCGWNCRHNFYPFFPGISEPLYTPERLAALNARDMEWDGQKLTRYEVEQKQRAAERNVRKYRRRSLMEAAAGEIDPKTAVKIKEWQAKVKELERVTGHPAADRVMVHGYGRSQAAKVTWAERKSLEKSQPHDTIVGNRNLTRKQLAEMDLDSLRAEVAALATSWYQSGRSGITFPNSVSAKYAAKTLASVGDRTSLTKDYKSIVARLKQLDAEQAGQTTVNAANLPVTILSSTSLHGIPNSITQVVNKKGGIDRNYYNADGVQIAQVSNNDHGHKEESGLGTHGEHAHDYIIKEDGEPSRQKARELTAQERRENDDIL